MVHNGKAYLSTERVKELFGWNEDRNLAVPTYKKMFANVDQIKVRGNLYFEQKAIYEMLKEKSEKSIFLREMQACLMLLLDIIEDTPSSIGRKLGFSHPTMMKKFLENEKYTPTAARVLVKMKRHYPHVLKMYDEGSY